MLKGSGMVFLSGWVAEHGLDRRELPAHMEQTPSLPATDRPGASRHASRNRRAAAPLCLARREADPRLSAALTGSKGGEVRFVNAAFARFQSRTDPEGRNAYLMNWINVGSAASFKQKEPTPTAGSTGTPGREKPRTPGRP